MSLSTGKNIWPEVKQFDTPLYERCLFEFIDTDSVRWGLRLTIRTEIEKSSEIVLAVVIELRPDSVFKNFVTSHPQWKKDPRPLILFCIQDLFWKLKLIEVDSDQPFLLEGGIKDTSSDAILHFRLTATRSSKADDATLVMLVNYANTHVYDQLKKVYEVNPEAKWTTKREKLVREHFYEQLAEKRRLTELVRRRRMANWKRTGKIIHYFIDESGDIGFKDTATHYISVACGIEQKKIQPLRVALRDIITAEWGNTKPSEIHFHKIPELKRATVLNRISECFVKFDANALCYIMLKRGLLKYALRCEAETRRREDQPMHTNLQHLLMASEANPQAFFLSSCVEEITTLVGQKCLMDGDSFAITHDSKHRTWMNEALKDGFQRGCSALKLVSKDFFGKAIKNAMNFSLSESGEEPCLWIADWLAWEVSQWIRSDELSPGFQKSVPRIQFCCFDEMGRRILPDRLGGNIIAELDDWPRYLPRVTC